MSIRAALSKASAFFFLSGFFSGKIQYLPIPFVPSVFSTVSLMFYLMAYSIWFIASHFHPNHTNDENEWYGFAQYKEQHLLAATLGFIATSLSIAGIFIPVLLIPAAWIFCASNFMWSTGEYHKFKNPHPQDENYSHTHQKAYLSYVFTLTSMSMVTAVCATLIFAFPPITIPVFLVSAILILGLSALVAEIWLNYNFGDHKPTPVLSSSYFQMTQTLSPKLKLEEVNSPAPYHGPDVFKSSINTREALLESEQAVNPEQDTCSMTC